MYLQNALVTVYLIPCVMKIKFTVKIIPFESGKCKIKYCFIFPSFFRRNNLPYAK